ncbi:hypothetical protein [Yinghuangia seranimata]|uniref:hypothetical protein n=1 Tax=Yinghuangia seranimata TaxID=408067 RepID=UPI00248D2897|nr:hypothetical protein [Yinghuangia seranimata]MDI2126918.1 hypothetical protein [Yinghuangia seranimata]
MSAHPNTQAEAAALLDAGAVLPLGAATGDDVDTLTARTYTHPALGDRPIVRLVPGTLGEAEDLALDFLGLTRDTGDDVPAADAAGKDTAPTVGLVRRETLGFPAWALVNDPANGHHALALVRDIERLGRQARSKPGTAKDGFDVLGTRLGRAVPHFLPTFYEQAARVFLGHENTTYAATFFGKAREAERVHNLPVEEQRLRAVFLEFAFAGALTAKALKEYARDLSRRLEAAEAWAQFRQLCVERCAAGMPPYAGLAEDARSMIKAVGTAAAKDGKRQSAAESAAVVAAEERALLADLLPTPAVTRAPLTFWKAFRPALVALCADEPAARARLLEIFPTPNTGAPAEADAFWLALLADTGAEALLTTPGARESGQSAAWLTRWAKHMRRSSWRGRKRDAAALGLAARMAEALRADGAPVSLGDKSWHPIDADLLDVCLAAGIPVADPNNSAQFALGDWYDDEEPGRRDLAAVAADTRYEPVLRKAVGALGSQGNGNHLVKAAAHPVLRGVMHAWLADRAADLETQSALPGARAALDALHPFNAVCADVNPDVVARVQAFDMAPLLARTLRVGLLDELGWPALDEAFDRLGLTTGTPTPGLHDDASTDKSELLISEAWPALVLASGGKAVVIGPDGVLLEHDLRLPSGLDSWVRPKFRYVDGDLLVMWWDEEQKGYWSSRPAEVFTVGGDTPGRWGGESGGVMSLPFPGGGRVSGGRVLHAGDTALPGREHVIGDGANYWVLHWRDVLTWHEYDPATGTRGRASLPAPFAAAVADGGRLVHEACRLMPLQPGLENSPFGTDGTLLGHWVRVDDNDTVTAGSVDGTAVTLPVGARRWDGRPQRLPMGALRLPGGACPTVFADDGSLRWADGEVMLGSADAWRRGGVHAAGTRLVPDTAFWHALRPRDEAGSAVLRAVTDDDARGLLAAAKRARDAAVEAAQEAAAATGEPAARPDPVPLAEVDALLPGITHPGLRAGVAGITRDAASLVRRLDGYGTVVANKRTGDDQDEYRPEHGTDSLVHEGLRGIGEQGGYGYYGGAPRWNVLNQIRQVAALLAAPGADAETATDGEAADGGPADGEAADAWTTTQVRLADGSGTWIGAIGRLGALLYRAASPLTAPANREALLLFVEELSADVFRRPGLLRRVVLCADHRDATRVGQVMRRGGRVVVIIGPAGWGSDRRQHWTALDYDPSGRFDAVADFRSHDAWPVDYLDSDDRAARVGDYVTAIRAAEAAAWWPDSVDRFAAATTARRTEAALLFAGLPDAARYGRIDLDTDQRTLLGLKSAEATAARDRLRGLDTKALSGVLGALLPADPADLANTGPDVDAGAAAWNTHFGHLLRLPDDIAADAVAASFGETFIDSVLNPDTSAELSRTTTQRLDEHQRLVADDSDAMLSPHQLGTYARAVRWLAYRLPYGDPLRAALPRLLAAVRARLADPGLLLDLDLEWTERGAYTSVALREAAGLPATGGAAEDGMVHVNDVIVLTPWHGEAEQVWVRTGNLTGPDDPDLAHVIALRGAPTGAAAAVRTLLGTELDGLAAAGADGPVGYAQDPAWSVPDLVDEVAKTHDLSADAAALYLQLLALPDPTDRNVVRWNGWKPARFKAAKAALEATDLVVSAKRSRASRTLFLPGGWHELKRALPLETWKDAFYEVDGNRAITPRQPVPDLFRAAWQRVQEGDAPAFEQLETRTTRRGRRR